MDISNCVFPGRQEVMVREHQRIPFVRAPALLAILALSVVSLTAGEEEEEEAGNRAEARLKVLSFGGNGNIGSAVLASLIHEDRADIIMTTRGGWHWDSDTRIGGVISSVSAEC